VYVMFVGDKHERSRVGE